eukprot:RCo012132
MYANKEPTRMLYVLDEVQRFSRGETARRLVRGASPLLILLPVELDKTGLQLRDAVLPRPQRFLQLAPLVVGEHRVLSKAELDCLLDRVHPAAQQPKPHRLNQNRLQLLIVQPKSSRDVTIGKNRLPALHPASLGKAAQREDPDLLQEVGVVQPPSLLHQLCVSRVEVLVLVDPLAAEHVKQAEKQPVRRRLRRRQRADGNQITYLVEVPDRESQGVQDHQPGFFFHLSRVLLHFGKSGEVGNKHPVGVLRARGLAVQTFVHQKVNLALAGKVELQLGQRSEVCLRNHGGALGALLLQHQLELFRGEGPREEVQ